jgi:protein SCO1/2
VTTRRDLLTTAITAGSVIGAGLWLRSRRAAPEAAAPVAGPPPLPHGTRLDPPRALPAIDLVDETGAAAGPAWLTGRWRLLFFGFTNCPEFCPVTLASLADARQRLAGLAADPPPDVVLVTVDPATDDPARLAEYLAGFGAGFHGLTGAPSALAVLYRALGVATRRVEMGDGSYMYDHGTAVYVIDPAGRWAALLPAPHAASTVAAAYRALVAPGG